MEANRLPTIFRKSRRENDVEDLIKSKKNKGQRPKSNLWKLFVILLAIAALFIVGIFIIEEDPKSIIEEWENFDFDSINTDDLEMWKQRLPFNFTYEEENRVSNVMTYSEHDDLRRRKYGVRKNIKIVVMTPPHCAPLPSYEDMNNCLAEIVFQCDFREKQSCFEKASKMCDIPLDNSVDDTSTYITSIVRTIPYLEDFGWSNIHTLPNFFHGKGIHDAVTEDYNEEQLKLIEEADLLIMDIRTIQRFHHHYPQKEYIAIDGSRQGSLGYWPTHLHEIAAIWRTQTTHYPIMMDHAIDGNNWLARISKLKVGAQQFADKSHKLPTIRKVLPRVFPALDILHRFKYPLDCGAPPEYYRFAAFFNENERQRPKTKPFRERKYDVAILNNNIPDNYKAGHGTLQDDIQLSIVQTLQSRLKPFITSVTYKNFRKDPISIMQPIPDLIAELEDVKVLIVPYSNETYYDAQIIAELLQVEVYLMQDKSNFLHDGVFGEKYVHMNELHGVLRSKLHLKEVARNARNRMREMLEYTDPVHHARELNMYLSAIYSQTFRFTERLTIHQSIETLRLMVQTEEKAKLRRRRRADDL